MRRIATRRGRRHLFTLRDDRQRKDLINDAMLWCVQHGLVVRTPDSEHSTQHAPVSMLPTPFSKEKFQEALRLAQPFNELTHLISQDSDFILNSLEATAEGDSNFTGRLVDIFNIVRAENASASNTSLGALRSDYMVDTRKNALRQIELNTVSSSFHALGSRVSEMHRNLSTRPDAPDWLQADRIPRNAAGDGLVRGLAAAWSQYGDDDAVVMMITQPNERNTFDQDWAAHGLWNRTDQRKDETSPLLPLRRIRTVRRSLAEIEERGTLSASGRLEIDGMHVAVAYYRAGYVPTDYPSEKEWSARLMVERANCIKGPSVGYQLVGTKKIQQILSQSGIVENYLGSNTSVAKDVRNSFAGLYSLTRPSSESKDAIQDAMDNPNRYVLKPQREGGGYNMYGDELRRELKRVCDLHVDDAGRDEYILMERIFPNTNPDSVLLRNGEANVVDTVSELGVYSTVLSFEGRIAFSEGSSAGHLLRTKVSSSDEGGVAAGFAVLDSPLLV